MKEETPGIDIHNRQRLLNSVRKALSESSASGRNKELIEDFIKTKKRRKEIKSVLRETKYYMRLRQIAELLGKDFDKATKQDMEELDEKISSLKVARGGKQTDKPISDLTRYDYMVIVRTFYRWLTGKKEPDIIEDFIPEKVKNHRLHPKDILIWDDVVKLSRCGTNPKQVSCPQVLFECGARVEEFLTLLIEDVEEVVEGKAVRLHFRKSKTDEGLRSPVVVRSAPALLHYLQVHPQRDNPKAPLWIKNNGKPMAYSTIRKILTTLKERSGLKKPVNPHAFRKSSATYFSGNLTEMEVKTRMGWTKSSKMLDIYCRVDEANVNEKIMAMHGVKDMDQVKEEIKNIECGWCRKINPLGQKTCIQCLRPLTLRPEEVAIKTEWDMIFRKMGEKFLKENPEIERKFLESVGKG